VGKEIRPPMLAGRAWLDRQRYSGYDIARMRHEIVLAPEAVQDLKRLKAHVRAMVRDAIEEHLRHQPTRISRSRIKRLRGLSHPQFRLRVGEMRIFYDVSDRTVAIINPDADAWLGKVGERA
jgi:mRNA-degrading endonuclease RelE of RelBE toxin-antitoxin system